VSTRIIREHFDGEIVPQSTCEECGTSYWLDWSFHPQSRPPQYCPFCGEEIVEFVEVYV
jgi:hypothetical protein